MPNTFDPERGDPAQFYFSLPAVLTGAVGLGTVLVAVTLWVGSVASRTSDNAQRLDRHADKLIRNDSREDEQTKLLSEILQRVTRIETKLEDRR